MNATQTTKTELSSHLERLFDANEFEEILTVGERHQSIVSDEIDLLIHIAKSHYRLKQHADAKRVLNRIHRLTLTMSSHCSIWG